MPRVYLAGPIKGLSYDSCVSWREYAIKVLSYSGIIGVSPMRGKELLRGTEKIIDGLDHVLCTPAGLVTRDRFDVKSCDLMLVNFLGAKEISIGTSAEFGWADAYGKPIVTVIEREGNVHDHPFIQRLTGFRVETLDEGLSVVKSILCY
jgi:nucleoside 2-deoxyribosyltransferase